MNTAAGTVPDQGGSHVPSHADPADPLHGEWLIDEASDESFPASDPSAVAMPSGRREIADATGKGDEMEKQADDSRALSHIKRLVDEEHRLMAQGAASEGVKAELEKIEVELDQCWDLLRQRRAARETGHDPAQAHVRPPGIVENYEG